MSNRNSMSKRMCIQGILCSMAIGSFIFVAQCAHAQPNDLSASQPIVSTATTSSQKADSMIQVADVNIYNAQTISQKQGAISVSFLLSNGEGSQAGVRYAIELLQKGQIVDELVYPETLNLSSNTVLPKIVLYEVPSFLSGTYDVRIVARNGDGLLLAFNQVGSVTLTGTGQYILLDASSCHLTVSDDASSTNYTVSQGIDITSSETLLLHCVAKNKTSSTVTVAPSFETHRRTIFGDVIQTGVLASQAFTLKAGTTQQITIPLPKATEPQAYDIIMSLTGNSAVISNKLIIHYVLKGETATISNLTLDKNAYNAGDTAHVQFFWVGAADNFVGSRLRPTTETGLSAVINITDTAGACASNTSAPLDPSHSVLNLSIAIQRKCVSPIVSTTIANATGTVLAHSRLSFNGVVSSSTTMEAEHNGETKTMDFSIIAIFAIAVILLLVTFGTYLFRKNRNMTMMLMIVVIASSFLFGAHSVDAATFTQNYYIWSPGGWSGDKTATFTVNLDNSTYTPGQTIRVTADAESGACTNSIDADMSGFASQDAYNNHDGQSIFEEHTSGETLYVTKNAATFAAPSTPGSYNFVYYGNLFVDPNSSGGMYGSYFCVGGCSNGILHTWQSGLNYSATPFHRQSLGLRIVQEPMILMATTGSGGRIRIPILCNTNHSGHLVLQPTIVRPDSMVHPPMEMLISWALNIPFVV